MPSSRRTDWRRLQPQVGSSPHPPPHVCEQEVVLAIERAHRLHPQLVTQELVDGARGLAEQAGALPGAPPPAPSAADPDPDHHHLIGEVLSVGSGGTAWGLGADGGSHSAPLVPPSPKAAAGAGAAGTVKGSGGSISMVARRNANAAVSGVVSTLLKRPMGRCDLCDDLCEDPTKRVFNRRVPQPAFVLALAA